MKLCLEMTNPLEQQSPFTASQRCAWVPSQPGDDPFRAYLVVTIPAPMISDLLELILAFRGIGNTLRHAASSVSASRSFSGKQAVL